MQVIIVYCVDCTLLDIFRNRTMYFDLILGSNHVFHFFLKNKVKQLFHMGGTLTFNGEVVFFIDFIYVYIYNININTNHSYISLQQREKKPEIPAAATIALIYRTEKIYEKKMRY